VFDIEGEPGRERASLNWQLFFDYVGVSGVIALALVGTVIGLAIAGRPVPEVLQSLTLMAAGFYFGAKTEGVTEDVRAWLHGLRGAK
jgi:hypothetical protein